MKAVKAFLEKRSQRQGNSFLTEEKVKNEVFAGGYTNENQIDLS